MICGQTLKRWRAVIPEQVNLAGEQVSGDIATVFVKVKEGDAPEHPNRLRSSWSTERG